MAYQGLSRAFGASDAVLGGLPGLVQALMACMRQNVTDSGASPYEPLPSKGI